jgi:hypothetical protein
MQQLKRLLKLRIVLQQLPSQPCGVSQRTVVVREQA